MNAVEHKYSAGGVVLHDGQVLTISSKIRNLVGLPKGHVENDESPELTAIREVKEETGYDTEIVAKLGDYTFEYDWTDGKHYIKTVSYYLMRLANEVPPVQNLQEGEDFVVTWMKPEEARDVLTFEESKDVLAKALDNIFRSAP